MRRLAIATASILIFGAAIGAPTASAGHGFPLDCGDQKRKGAGWYDLEAYNVDCSKARDFAKRFTFRGFKEGPWHCSDETAGFEQTLFSCYRRKDGIGHQHVRFIIGS